MVLKMFCSNMQETSPASGSISFRESATGQVPELLKFTEFFRIPTFWGFMQCSLMDLANLAKHNWNLSWISKRQCWMSWFCLNWQEVQRFGFKHGFTSDLLPELVVDFAFYSEVCFGTESQPSGPFAAGDAFSFNSCSVETCVTFLCSEVAGQTVLTHHRDH